MWTIKQKNGKFINFYEYYKSFHFDICRAIKLPTTQKKLQQKTESQVKKEGNDEAVLEKGGGGRAT